MSEKKSNFPPVGIDLGTTYSVLATLDAEGRPVTIQNAEGDVTTPSVVMFDRAAVVVGKEALKVASYEPDAVAMFAKRDIGAHVISKHIRGARIPPEVVEGLILRKLRDDAQLKLGPIRPVVITVPAYFNEPRRKATQDAGRLAGLEVLDIINEPTAAAVAYGVQQGFLSPEGKTEGHEIVLVYDLGGGTFDVTLMHIEGRDHTALATSGDVYLGGVDWDQRIVDFVAERFMEEHGGLDPRQDSAGRMRLSREAEDVKRALSARPEVSITFEFAGRLLRTVLTRRQFDEMCLDLVERTRFTMRKVLKDAQLEWGDVTRVLLVGGSTRMPMVQEMVERETGLKADRSLSPDEAVAHGAAVYAGFLTAGDAGPRTNSVGSIVNVNSHDLGVLGTEKATGRPRRRVLIPRNTALPAYNMSRFVTRQDGQRSVQVTIVEGGDDSGHNATTIGRLSVRDLPAGLPAGSDVQVTFQYEENGRLTVSARLPKVGAENRSEIERASGMSEEELETWGRCIESGTLLEHLVAMAEQSEEQEELAEVLFEDQGGGASERPMIFEENEGDSFVSEEAEDEDVLDTLDEEDVLTGDSALDDFLRGRGDE